MYIRLVIQYKEMQNSTANNFSYKPETGEGSGFAASVPPRNVIILEKSFAHPANLLCQYRSAGIGESLKREILSKMIDDGL